MALSRVGLIANDAVSNAQIAPNTIIPEDMEDRSITSVKLAIPQSLPYSANVTGNASINRSLAVGYTDGRVPQANLDVKGNTYISGSTTVTGKISATSVTPEFYGANVTGNASVTRSMAVGYTDGRVPQANLDVKNNVFIGGQTSISGDVGIGLTGTPIGPLQIYHATTPRIFLTNSTSGSGSTNEGTMFDHTGSDTMISNNSNGGIIFRANEAEGMRLTTTGLGIGATPDRKFNVNSGGVGFIATLTDGVATNFIIRTSAGGHGFFGTEAGSTQLAFVVANSEKARFNTAGDLAIGNLSPGKQFNVTKAAMANVATQAYGANTQLDLDTAQNFTTTLTGPVTFSNPTNVIGGQTGSIFIRQDGTGSRTASWGTHWHFTGGTAPTLTTTAKAVDRIDYITCNAVCVMAVASLDIKVGA